MKIIKKNKGENNFNNILYILILYYVILFFHDNIFQGKKL